MLPKDIDDSECTDTENANCLDDLVETLNTTRLVDSTRDESDENKLVTVERDGSDRKELVFTFTPSSGFSDKTTGKSQFGSIGLDSDSLSGESLSSVIDDIRSYKTSSTERDSDAGSLGSLAKSSSFGSTGVSGSISVVNDNSDSEIGDYSDTYDCNASDSEDPKGYVPGGYHPVKIGDIYDNRYRIEAKLGWGYFSTVWLASDLQARPHSFVAIKVQRSAKAHTNAVYDEISLLKKVRDGVLSENWMSYKGAYTDLLGDFYNKTRGVISYLRDFRVSGPNGEHVCVVFEVMGPNLLTLIKLYKFNGIPMELVRKITTHVLIGLDYLHNVCGIIHTDIKPENVLVTSPIVSYTPLSANKLDSETEDTDTTLGNTCKIPYVKNKIKPRMSDPSLVTSYNNMHSLQDTLYRRPYHHIPWNVMKPILNLNKGNINPDLYHPYVLDSVGVNHKFRFRREKPPTVVKTVEGNVQLHPISTDAFERNDAIFKICDLGNACWINNHFTEEIQTRQYRSPEVILRCGYTQTSDLWSLACMIFELVTGDYLFDPRGEDANDRDFHHLQLIVELLGPIPKKMYLNSKKAQSLQIFKVNNIKRWPLESVLIRKYKVDSKVASELSDFLLCMLKISPSDRMSASALLRHKWLQIRNCNTLLSSTT
ncbi:protein kinase domain-containing protein [Theileria equi strain WA]|uniref:non-specific serine/threonine protein kinase n=1 Tax=Theileria equi strain WA TaxID=1537102 RepID=L0B177_THEEQ|nr:protein kinase domain-containing protein [Theileria equi strain WA]AFZ81263.1 protein kinase domain-containing protein [Theileria equi strain WA]|eukprot:XP_004830929.1 protein kinase domain-containing protein [Theileria equi strain WA]